MQRILFYEILKVACLVAIRTWFIAKSFLLFFNSIFIHRYLRHRISRFGKTVTSLSCLGRVVIGSLFVYQTSGAGSNPVASTTVLTFSARSIGNGQKSCISFAWEGLGKSGPFPISLRLVGQFHGYWLCVILYFQSQFASEPVSKSHTKNGKW